MKKYHIISNPIAGKNTRSKNLHKVEAYLTQLGVPFETHISQSHLDATNIVKELSLAGETEFIVVGGDGTLNEVLNGITDFSACHVGLVPSGTGNDFAEKIGIPFSPEKACDIILNCECKETDYFEIGGVRCMNVAGMGIDVDVLERCHKGKMKGKPKYLLSLLHSFFAFKGYQVEIVNDGKSETRDVLIAAVCNGAQLGGGIQICPTAEVDDGKLNAIIVDCVGGKIALIKAFIELMRGRILQYPRTKHIVCESIRFIPKNPTTCPVQLDGELYSDLQFDAQIKRGLKFYRP
jgi:YegS/Rv2252/BmrU family lipid kinase